MGGKVLKWSMTRMAHMCTKIVQNRFDAFVIIEGNTGLGKSTLAIHIARRVAQNFKKMGSKDYKFHWKHTFLYTTKETKHFLHKWKSIGIGDEAILLTHNRDFYSEDSKTIIKMINTNRDHNNLFIMCVPSFATLDSQIKNLCKIRITVVRRGLAIVQTPNKTIYVKDKWDTATNEKIERNWIMKGVKNPHYSKLTTFRGLLRFSPLSESAEGKYQNTKTEKRNIIAREEQGIEDENANTPYEIMIKMLKEGQVKNGTLIDGFALANGFKPSTFKNKIGKMLKERGEKYKISEYYWDKKAKKADVRDVGAMVV